MPTPTRPTRSRRSEDLRSAVGPSGQSQQQQGGGGLLVPTRIIGLLANSNKHRDDDDDDDLEDQQPPALTLPSTGSSEGGAVVDNKDRFQRVAISTDPPPTEAPPPPSAVVAARSTSLASGGVYYADEEEQPSLDQSWLSVPPPPPLPVEEEVEEPDQQQQPVAAVVEQVQSSDTTDTANPSPEHNTEKMMAGTPHWDQNMLERHGKPNRKKCLWLGIAVIFVIVAAAVSVPVVLWQIDNHDATTAEISTSSSSSSNQKETPITTTTNAPASPSPQPPKTDAPSPRDKTAAGQTEDDTTTRTSRPSTSIVRSTSAPKEQTSVQTTAPVTAPVRAPAPVAPPPSDSEIVQRLLQILPLEYQSSLNSNAIAWMMKSTANNNITTTSDTALQQRYAMVALDLALLSRHREEAPRECDWSGVTCDDNATLVTSIVWTSQQLNGTLPSELGLLPQLTILDLADNAIGGPLPEALYTLSSSLQHLHLFRNQLTGTLSESVANLAALEKLLLGENQLSGPLPQGLGAGEGDNARPLGTYLQCVCVCHSLLLLRTWSLTIPTSPSLQPSHNRMAQPVQEQFQWYYTFRLEFTESLLPRPR